MITPDYVRTMARYNEWQNSNLFDAAETLSDAERRVDRKAFFGSIHRTLDHLLWGDRIWMSRFSDSPPPEVTSIPGSAEQTEQWDELMSQRRAFDRFILDWASSLDAAVLEGMLNWYSVAAERDMSAPRWLLITHMFNHQTHHRGQVHSMLTQAGATPGDTDLMLLPPDNL